MNINDSFHVPILSFSPQVCLSRLKFVHRLSVEIECEQSYFLFRFSEGSASALECQGEKWGWQPKKKKEKKVSFWCLSHLTPSVTRVVICRTFCLTDQWKRETATAESSLCMKLSQGLITYNTCKCCCLFFERGLWTHCWYSSNLLMEAPYPSVLRCLCCRLRCRSGLQLFSQDGWSMDSKRFVCSWAKVEKFLWKPNCNTVCSQNSCE